MPVTRSTPQRVDGDFVEPRVEALDQAAKIRFFDALLAKYGTGVPGRPNFTSPLRVRPSLAWDGLVVLDQGRIVEQDTHDGLLALDGHYELLWKRPVGRRPARAHARRR